MNRIWENRSNNIVWMCVFVLFTVFGCGGKDDPAPNPLTLISAKVNGAALSNGATNIPVEAQLELVFSATLDIPKFEAAFSFTNNGSEPNYQLTYSNASSKVVINASQLAFDTNYEVKVAAGTIGANGQSLQSDLIISFTTVEDGTVRQMAPCTSASQDCYQKVSLTDASENSGDFGFYSTYPIYLENAEWEKLKYAIIVVHGANRDANNYFNFLMNPLNAEALLESTILISPEFKSSETASSTDMYWANDWREGQKSNSSAKISSFEAIDALIERLSDKSVFPVLEKIIVTGHSSGALFTQVYGATNMSESTSEGLSFEYVVANSQYFYYPDDQRFNEANNQFYVPTGCATYNHWPLGYANAPAYVNTRSETEIDANLLGRSFTYFLGNGTQADPALNMNDCGAVLLGSSRFKRGEHIFAWLESQYSGQHNSAKVVVDGIGHDGQGMYQSNDFKTLLQDLLK